MLGIDPKWLSLNKDNAEIMLKIIEDTKLEKILGKIYKNLKIYINNDKNLMIFPMRKFLILKKFFGSFL